MRQRYPASTKRVLVTILHGICILHVNRVGRQYNTPKQFSCVNGYLDVSEADRPATDKCTTARRSKEIHFRGSCSREKPNPEGSCLSARVTNNQRTHGRDAQSNIKYLVLCIISTK